MNGKNIHNSLILSFLALVLSLPKGGFAQNNHAYNAIWELIIEADSLLYTEPKVSKIKASQAKAWALEIKDTNTWAEATSTLAEAYYYQNNLDTAKILIESAIDVFLHDNDSSALSMCYFILANIESDFGHYKTAIRLYKASSEIDLAMGDSLGATYLLSNIAGIHYNQGDYELAKEKYEALLKLSKQTNNLRDEGNALLGLALIQIKQGDVADALLYINRAIEIFSAHEDKLTLTVAYSAKGQYYARLKNKVKAIEACSMAKKLSTEYDDPYTKVEVLSVYAQVLHDFEDYKDAYNLALTAFNVAQTQPGFYLKQISLKPLSKSAEQLGKFKEATQYYKLLNRYEDSIHQNNINEFILEYDLNSKNSENLSLQRKTYLQQQVIEREKIIQITLAILALLFIVLVGTLWFAFSKRQRFIDELKQKNLKIAQQQEALNEANISLKQNNKLLDAQNSNKDKVFSILSHDLREPFNQLLGVLELMEGDHFLEKDQLDFILPQLKESIINAQNSVINLLHWSKNQLSEIVTEPERFSIQNLIENIKRSLLPTLNRKELNLKTEYDSYLEIYADYYQIEIALRNVLSNAIKYSTEGGNLKVTVRKDFEKNEVVLAVTDEGKGLSEDQIEQILSDDKMQTSTLGTFNERGTGLGLNIVKEFLAANKGYLTIISEPNKGSTFQLHLSQNIV